MQFMTKEELFQVSTGYTKLTHITRVKDFPDWDASFKD